MATTLAVSSIAGIERALAELRGDGDGSVQRTSVLTHLAWIPPAWEQAAEEVLEALAERHPSRTILLYPEPDAGSDGIAAEVQRTCFPLEERHVCAEVVRIRLRGRSVGAPASVVLPLLLPDLPVFLRWRGLPGFDAPEYAQLTGVTDRLVVDSGEWPELRYAELARSFERVVVSDLAWRRTLHWRAGIAQRWPFAGGRLRVVGPEAEALMLAGWLRSRLRRAVELEHERAERLEGVSIDGEEVPPPSEAEQAPSDLLSAELEVFGRDLVYEEAVTRT